MRKSFVKILIIAAVALSVGGNLASAKILAIKGGTIHTLGKKGTLRNGVILIENGRIKRVGANISIPDGAEVIDATGKIVVPGFMHSGSYLGLSEISLTKDSNEHSAKKSPLSAAFDVRYGLKSNSVVVADNRRHGLTHAISQPSGSDGIFSGSGAVISLTNSPDMVFAKGPMIANPAKAGNRNLGWGKIRLILDQVTYYNDNRSRIMKGEGPGDFLLTSYNMDALVPVIKGRQKLVLMVDSVDDIRQAIALKKDYGIDVIISGAAEGWQVAQELAAAKVPVLINPQTNLPSNFGALASSFHNAAKLAEAGVEFAISPGGMARNHNAFMVAQMAGLAVAHGLDWDRALRAITLSPARIFGIDKAFGSIEKGKIANIVVWDGDPLEVTSNVAYVIVGGKNYPLVSRRTLLRDRYLGLKNKPYAFH